MAISMTPGYASQPIILIGGLILFLLVGIGPALHLIARQTSHRLYCAICLAPAIGFAVVAMLPAPFVVLGQPIISLALPLTLVALAFSCGLLILDRRACPEDYPHALTAAHLRTAAVVILCCAVVIAALILPSAIGGPDYRYPKGTPWDGKNYMLGSWFPQPRPWSVLNQAWKIDSILSINPA